MRIEIPSSLVNDQKRIPVVDWVTAVVLEELGPNCTAAVVSWEFAKVGPAALVLTVTLADTVRFRMEFPLRNFGREMDEFPQRFRDALHGVGDSRVG